MKKHFFGAMLFIAIVGFSVFIYAYFSYDDSDCGSAMTAQCVSTAGPLVTIQDVPDNFATEDISAKLTYIEASMRSRTVKTRLILDWQGDGAPPKAVWLQVRFHNSDGSDAGWVSEPMQVNDPFRIRDGRALETSLECGMCKDLPRNLYASVSVWGRANIEKNLVYKTGDMTPVVVQEQR